MADRKSSDNPLLTTLANGDLFDILDADEATASLKNKSITKADLFNQISSELSLSGSPVLTSYTSGFETGYSGTLTFYKLSRMVFFSFSITVSSPGSWLAVNLGVIAGGLLPIVGFPYALTSDNNTQAGRLVFNNLGQVQIGRNGTVSTVLPNGEYEASGFYFSAA